VKEPDYNAMVGAGKLRFMPPRFMTVRECSYYQYH
jgi:hypothetical protein